MCLSHGLRKVETKCTLEGISDDCRTAQIGDGRGKPHTYACELLPTHHDGFVMQLTNAATGAVYQVYWARNGQDDTCDCLGYKFHGHCKHLDLVACMIENNWLPRTWDPDYPTCDDPIPCECCGAPVDDPFCSYCEDCFAAEAGVSREAWNLALAANGLPF